MSSQVRKKVIIVGGGFAGLNAAKALGSLHDLDITIVDQRNHHLFQPLLYQVASAGLSPADIASPIRSVLSKYSNITTVMGCLKQVRLAEKRLRVTKVSGGDESPCQEAPASHATSAGAKDQEFSYDYLVLACGASHSYFGHDEWEPFAPGLKTLEQATEIRRRILLAFEEAENEPDPARKKTLQTFVIVGAGPTGVEVAGAIGEMSRHTLKKDFRSIDPSQTRVLLIEGGPRILPTFDPKLSIEALRALEELGVEARTQTMVTNIDAQGVHLGERLIEAGCVIWAAGVKPAGINATLGVPLDRQGRVIVEPDLSLAKFREVFVMGDQAHFHDLITDRPLPGLAPVAIQQGRHLARIIKADLQSKPRPIFSYRDKGQMATIGRSQAVAESGKMRFHGFTAWIAWLFVHIYYLIGFQNRVLVLIQWTWSYFSFRRGARLIVSKKWQSFSKR